MYEFLSNPLITFILFGFGSWILFITIVSSIAIRSGVWIDRQLEDEE